MRRIWKAIIPVSIAYVAFAVDPHCAAQDPLLSSTDTISLPKPACGVCGSCTATFPDPSVQYEWMEPAAGRVVPVSGTVTTSDVSGNDVPFPHPFGSDYEGQMMPDANAPVNVANTSSNRGLLNMEMEQGLIPPVFRATAGDRIVMHGRWIVDCGHNDYHAEIHPPALIASAHISPYTGGSVATFLALPYLTEQVYEPTGKGLIETLIDQFTLGDFLPLQAYPSIRSNPFATSFSARYRVRLQTRTGDLKPKLYYHFTARPGVAVTVTPPTDADPQHAQVTISVDATTYSAHPPKCMTKQLSFSDADKMAGFPEGTIEGAVVAAAGSGLILGHPEKLFAGILEKQCSVGYEQGLTALPAADNKILTDDSQPFPVYGWISSEPSPWHNACPRTTLEECRQQYLDCMQSAGGKGGPTREACAATLLRCPKDCPLPAGEIAQLALSISVVPQADQGFFTVQLDKVNTALSQVQHHLASGPMIVAPGQHSVSVVAGLGTSLAKYSVAYSGDCDAQGNVNVALGQGKSCTITSTAIDRPDQTKCLKACQTDFQDCLSGPHGPGNPTPQQCSRALASCRATCR